MFAIVFVFPCGEKVPGGTYETRAKAKAMKVHYEKVGGKTQYGKPKVQIVTAKEAA